jgi:hypothetical protein
MDIETIKARIEQLRAEQAEALRQAQLQQAAYDGAIQALEQLITGDAPEESADAPDPEAASD